MKFLMTHINILLYEIEREKSRKKGNNITEENQKAFAEMLELMQKVKNICESHIN